MTVINLDLISQDKLTEYNEKKYYKTARINLAGQKPLKIKDAKIESDSLYYTNYLTREPEKIALSAIGELKVKTGTRIIGGAILGTVIPTIFILEALLDNKPNADNAGVIAATVIGGGAILGAAIGYSIPIWETYQIKDANKTAFSIDYTFQFGPNITTSGLVLNF